MYDKLVRGQSMIYIFFTAARNKKHDASAYRAILREAKASGSNRLEPFLDRAKQLD